jgi:hypothetical protein
MREQPDDDGLPHFEDLEGPQLPDVSNGHRGQAEEAVADDPIEGLRDGLRVLGQSEKLSALTELALDRAHDILSMRLEPTMPDYLKLLAFQQQTLAAVLSTQTKVDETRLRSQQSDKLGDILARIRGG